MGGVRKESRWLALTGVGLSTGVWIERNSNTRCYSRRIIPFLSKRFAVEFWYLMVCRFLWADNVLRVQLDEVQRVPWSFLLRVFLDSPLRFVLLSTANRWKMKHPPTNPAVGPTVICKVATKIKSIPLFSRTTRQLNFILRVSVTNDHGPSFR